MKGAVDGPVEVELELLPQCPGFKSRRLVRESVFSRGVPTSLSVERCHKCQDSARASTGQIRSEFKGSPPLTIVQSKSEFRGGIWGFRPTRSSKALIYFY